jgi:hypothetical protein
MPGRRGRPESLKRRFGNLLLQKRACAKTLEEVESLKKEYKAQGKKVRVIVSKDPECNFKIYTN